MQRNLFHLSFQTIIFNLAAMAKIIRLNYLIKRISKRQAIAIILKNQKDYLLVMKTSSLAVIRK